MKQYCTLHVDKSTTAGGSLGQHIDRKKQPKNADPAKENLNFAIVKDGENIKLVRLKEANQKPLATRVKERIAEGYTGKTAIRKDAVTQLNVLQTGSHDRLNSMNGKELTEWALENYRFLAKEYGVQNIVGFAVHRDERTPHIHATIVPLTPDGRLSAREVVGNGKKLADLQNRYAEAMKPFKLQRGEVGSKVAHVTTAEYYKTVNSIQPIQEENTIDRTTVQNQPTLQLERPPLVFHDDYMKTQQQRIDDEYRALIEKNEKLRAQVAYTTEANFRLKQESNTVKRTYDKTKEGVLREVKRETVLSINRELKKVGYHIDFGLNLSRVRTPEEEIKFKQEQEKRNRGLGLGK